MLSDRISRMKILLDINDEYITIRGLISELEDKSDPINIIKIDKIFINKDEKKTHTVPTNIKIRELVDEGDVEIIVHPLLPHLPFSLLAAGTRGAGKSFLTTNFFNLYHSWFDKIFVFSPTIFLDRKFKLLFEKLGMKDEMEVGVNIFTEYDESVLNIIMTRIEKFNKNKPFKDKAQILFVFDDIVSSIPKNQRRTIFNKLILNNRHYAASVIINSQTLKLMDSNFRKVSSQIVLFKTYNVVELYAYCEEFSAVLGDTKGECRMNFLKYYNKATEDEHSFLFINLHHKNLFFKNLDIPLRMNEHGEVEEGFSKVDLKEIIDIVRANRKNKKTKS